MSGDWIEREKSESYGSGFRTGFRHGQGHEQLEAARRAELSKPPPRNPRSYSCRRGVARFGRSSSAASAKSPAPSSTSRATTPSASPRSGRSRFFNRERRAAVRAWRRLRPRLRGERVFGVPVRPTLPLRKAPTGAPARAVVGTSFPLLLLLRRGAVACPARLRQEPAGVARRGGHPDSPTIPRVPLDLGFRCKSLNFRCRLSESNGRPTAYKAVSECSAAVCPRIGFSEKRCSDE
jgi:hypothetical protein